LATRWSRLIQACDAEAEVRGFLASDGRSLLIRGGSSLDGAAAAAAAIAAAGAAELAEELLLDPAWTFVSFLLGQQACSR